MDFQQQEPLEDLERRNPRTGDVALCGSFGPAGTSVVPPIDSDRISFVASLDSRADLERLIRALARYPKVRHLLIHGEDAKVCGEALLSLWRDGLEESGQIAGSRGRLAGDLDPSSLETLRGEVALHDLRGRDRDEVDREIAALPAVASERTALSLSDPEIPKRKIFLSRKTSFPIFSADVGDGWLQLLNLALKVGTPRASEGGSEVAQALNAVVTLGLPVIAEDLELDELPQVEGFPSVLDFNGDDFECFFERVGGPDAIARVFDRLAGTVDGNPGAMVVLMRDEFGAIAEGSSLISASFDVVDGKLYGSFVQGRADVYTDWPSEALALARLQQSVAEQLGVDLGASTFVIQSVELHARDFARTQGLLESSFKRPLPLQVDHSGVFLFGNDGGQARAMLLDHDAGTIFWEQAFESPQELSWYIVDAMPWLLPQHIRYVGQECATLTRAMQESECYLQG